MCYVGCKTFKARDVIGRFPVLELMTAMRFKVTAALRGAHTEHLTRSHFTINIGLLQRGLLEYSLSGVMKRAISSSQEE